MDASNRSLSIRNSRSRRNGGGEDGRPSTNKKLSNTSTQRKDSSMTQTIFDGWTGQLADLQHETIRILSQVRRGGGTKRPSHGKQHTIGKGWATVGAMNKSQSSPTMRSSASHRFARNGGLGSRSQSHEENDISLPSVFLQQQQQPATPVPLSRHANAWEQGTDDDDSRLMVTDTNLSQRYMVEEQELPVRTLDFDYERERVAQARDTFIAHKDVRLTALENEKARLDRLALRQQQNIVKQERQHSEVAARREWLKRDLAALKIERLYRGHLARRRCSLVREMTEIERSAEGDWLEVRDEGKNERWFFNPTTGMSQWDVPLVYIDRTIPPEKVRILGAAEVPKGETVNEDEELVRDNPPIVPESEDGGPLDGPPALPPLVPPKHGSSMRLAGADEYDEDEGADADMFGRPEDRFFSMNGKKNSVLRQTVSQALKSSKWDSVATLIVGMSMSQEEIATTKPSKKAPQMPVLEKHVAKRKKLFADPTKARPMVAVLKTNCVKGQSPSRSRTPWDKLAPSKPEILDDNVLGLSIRDAATPGFELPPMKESAVREASETNNAEGIEGVTGPKLVKEVCFNCWSAGRGKKCMLHNVDKDGHPITHSGESQLMCRNWDLSVMRRRYRSEEIQEIFAKSASSLRFDRKRKMFVTVVEQKHTIYRSLNALIAKHHLRMRTVLHARMWLVSLVDYFRRKDTAQMFGGRKDVGRFYRTTVSMRNFFDLKRYTKKNQDKIPIPPITGRSLPELNGEVQYLFKETDQETGDVRNYIISLPTPVPSNLYQARKYELPVPLSIELPAYQTPKHASPQEAGLKKLSIDYRDEAGQPVTSIKQFAQLLVKDIVDIATDQVISPPGPEAQRAMELEQVKYAAPVTVRFAKVSRKPTNSMMAVGGFSPELVISQLVQTYISAQYGNFLVMETSSISPGISPEITMVFKSFEVPYTISGNLLKERPLIHAVNTRKSPAVTLMTGIKESEKFAQGLNRPDQTGESSDVGFRTSQFTNGLPILSTVSPCVFTPTAEVTTLNKARSNDRVTSNADLDYPFCEPSSRPSTTMDYYHLLLTGVCTPNKPQVFTAIGMQLPGQYLKRCDKTKPLGATVTAVYRSWAFTQKSLVEEFITDDGVPYWYDRRTKETYWERPLMPAEQVPVKQGGTVLGITAEAAESDASKTAKVGGAIRYQTQEVRKIILRKHETPEEMHDRRSRVAKEARARMEKQDPTLMLKLDQIAAIGRHPNAEGVQDGTHTGSPLNSSATSSVADNLDRVDVLVRKNSVVDEKAMMSQTSAAALSSPQRRTSVVDPSATIASPQRRPSTANEPGTAGTLTAAGCTSGKGLPTLKKADEMVVSTISTAIAEALPFMQGQAHTPDDLVRLGMGLGMCLQANGVLEGLKQSVQVATAKEEPIKVESDPRTEISMVSEEWVKKREEQLQQKHPVGTPDPDLTVGIRPITKLDHTSEAELQERIRTAKPLSLLEKVKGLSMVPTPTPDEASREPCVMMDPIDKVISSVPVLARPESLLNREFLSHKAGGINTAFTVPDPPDDEPKPVDTLAQAGKLRSLRDSLPVGFLNAIYDRHVAKQHVDYLPDVPNLPQLNCIGAIKPRSAAEDWLAIGFDPWSAGKEILFSEHINMLSDQKLDISDLEGSGITVQRGADGGAFIDTMDREGAQRQADAQAELQIFEERFNLLASYCRHGKYRDIEETISQVEWELPIDYADKYGNTILHIAVQNGSKRITKLLLRRGADINKQNLSGETCLHYVYAYGFEELGEYLKSKGADDTITNIDGLTCYEGLHVEDVEKL